MSTSDPTAEQKNIEGCKRPSVRENRSYLFNPAALPIRELWFDEHKVICVVEKSFRSPVRLAKLIKVKGLVTLPAIGFPIEHNMKNLHCILE